MENKTTNRDLKYYQNIDKVYWVVANDIKNLFKQYQKIPCLFVELSDNDDNNVKILDIDHAIEFDEYRYTAWRKVIGIKYGIRTDVYLIKDNQLYTLDGDTVDFDELSRSDIVIDKKYLGIMDIKN